MNRWGIPIWLEEEVKNRDRDCVYCGVKMIEKGECEELSQDVIYVTLPNTRLLVRCSHKKYVLACGAGRDNGVLPDVEIVPSREDIQSGRDTAVEWVKQSAQGNN